MKKTYIVKSNSSYWVAYKTVINIGKLIIYFLYGWVAFFNFARNWGLAYYNRWIYKIIVLANQIKRQIWNKLFSSK